MLFVSSEWSLFKMFSRTLTEACPLASSSKIHIDITDNPEVWFQYAIFVMSVIANVNGQL